MNKVNLYDIISPIMIGPSSSHTAGAVRLGLLARNIFQADFFEVNFKLYNSYAHTGKGHGTEKGLLAGVLGLDVDDRLVRDIFNSDLAKSVKYTFSYEDNFRRHPNAVDIDLSGKYNMHIEGESVGAGKIVIKKINEFNVSLNGEYNTIVLVYKDKPGMISYVTDILQKNKVNIASLACDRNAKGKDASMVICLDEDIAEGIITQIQQNNDIYFVSYVKKLGN